MKNNLYFSNKANIPLTFMESALEYSNECSNNKSAKRVSIVSIKMVKEGTILYKERKISSPSDATKIAREFLLDSDREQLIVICLDNPIP